MNIYLVSESQEDSDIYDCSVVAADSEEDVRRILARKFRNHLLELIGTTDRPAGVIHGSYSLCEENER